MSTSMRIVIGILFLLAMPFLFQESRDAAAAVIAANAKSENHKEASRQIGEFKGKGGDEGGGPTCNDPDFLRHVLLKYFISTDCLILETEIEKERLPNDDEVRSHAAEFGADQTLDQDMCMMSPDQREFVKSIKLAHNLKEFSDEIENTKDDVRKLTLVAQHLMCKKY